MSESCAGSNPIGKLSQNLSGASSSKQAVRDLSNVWMDEYHECACSTGQCLLRPCAHPCVSRRTRLCSTCLFGRRMDRIPCQWHLQAIRYILVIHQYALNSLLVLQVIYGPKCTSGPRRSSIRRCHVPSRHHAASRSCKYVFLYL